MMDSNISFGIFIGFIDVYVYVFLFVYVVVIEIVGGDFFNFFLFIWF